MVDPTLLTETDFFRDLNEEDLAILLPACTVRTLRRGDLLFEEGDDCSELFVVSSGLVAISKKSIDGRESVVALMERGELKIARPTPANHTQRLLEELALWPNGAGAGADDVADAAAWAAVSADHLKPWSRRH